MSILFKLSEKRLSKWWSFLRFGILPKSMHQIAQIRFENCKVFIASEGAHPPSFRRTIFWPIAQKNAGLLSPFSMKNDVLITSTQSLLGLHFQMPQKHASPLTQIRSDGPAFVAIFHEKWCFNHQYSSLLGLHFQTPKTCQSLTQTFYLLLTAVSSIYDIITIY